MKYSDNKNYDRKLKSLFGEEIPKLAHRPWTLMEETELLRAVWRRDNAACYMRHSQTTSHAMHAYVVQVKSFGTDDWDALRRAHPFPGRSNKSLAAKWRYVPSPGGVA